MRKWQTRVIAGAATVIVGTVLALVVRSGHIETDLVERAGAALKADGQPWGAVTADGRDLTLSGTAPSEGYREMGRQSVDRVWGVRVVKDASDILAVADPFVWTAEKSASGVKLAGNVPFGAARGAVADAVAAALPGLAVEDGAADANGAPDEKGWLAAVGFAAARLANLETGKVEISGTGLSFSGLAADRASYDAYRAALSQLPAGYTLVSDAVMPPKASPYVWTAESGSGKLVLGGSMPGAHGEADILGSMATILPGIAVENGTVPASGAPEGFVGGVVAALHTLSRLEDGTARLEDDKLTIRGRARHFDSEADIRSVLDKELPAGIALAELTVTPPAVAPFTFSAKSANGVVVLEGFVPSEEVRAALVAAAAKLGEKVDDRLVVASGAPAGFADEALFAIGALGNLSEGTASLSDLSLTVNGKAPTAEMFIAVNTMLDGSLPEGMTIALREIEGPAAPPPPAVVEPVPAEPAAAAPVAAEQPATPAPFGWSIEAGADGIVLSGIVPNEEARAAILSLVARLFPGRAVDDRLVVGEGAPEGFAAAANAAIEAVGRLMSGRAALTDKTLELSGETFTERAIGQILDALKSALPAGFTTSGGLTVAPPAAEVADAECQTLLSGILAGNTIRFRSGEAVISEDSFGLLDSLAYASQRCPAARIEIAGHTDSDGSDAANQTLSEARAGAVVTYLTDAGVVPDRLTSRGYGETMPVADNGTAEGKARNRRIEFTIRQ
ncbi:MAG: OmpA family protein [Hyphomicrobiales bacterium]